MPIKSGRGDLAQAISDEEKARSALKLARQTLDRLMVLERTSAIAVKEREQAQSDFAQARSELERAEARLRAIGAPVDQKANSRLLYVKVPVSGSVDDVVGGLREVIDAGAQTILLNPVGRDVAEDREQMERLAAEVIPQLS